MRLGKGPDDPLVGLSLSGGGIRSATFGLGVLQALKRLGLFESLDYVSTVSGGGYIGGWLQAALANKVGAAVLDFPYREPREVRFLRGFSNYLTPRLGLFSGDTWAAVGVSLRNLILNFAILSLSLAVPLFVPWLLALLFWMVVAWHGGAGAFSCAVVVVAAAVLLSLTTRAGAANMARPLASGGWTKSGASAMQAVRVYSAAVLPPIVAIGLASPMVWAQATDASQVVGDGMFVVLGAVAYAGAWLVGLAVGYFGGRARRTVTETEPAQDRTPVPLSGDSDAVPVPPRAVPPEDAVGRAVWAGFVLVSTAFLAGLLGTAVWVFGGRVLLGWIAGSQYAWRLALLLVPAGVASLFLCVTVHLGLAGRFMSEETREWWGRVGGVQLLVALLLAVVGVISLGGPHLPDYLAQQSAWFEANQTAIWSVVGAAWAALTGAGVAAGRSARTANGEGTTLFEWVGRIAPVAFVVGYLLILSGVIRRVVQVPSSSLSLSLVELEGKLAAFAGAAWRPDGLGAAAPTFTAGWFDVGTLVLLAGGTACAAFVVSWVVDLNEFSLHMFYRNRLVRCFLGAPREERNANPFTGFDSDDDLALTDTVKMGLARPYPIFNTALNLVGGQNLAWQQRKAASFVFTPDYCGFEYRTDEQGSDHDTRLSAYAPTGEHGGDPHSLTVGLAVATSGAAASPNMGYHSSPTLSFLMTVFNVRLGWWLRNPVDRAVWRDPSQRLSLRELLYELLGMTTDTRKWVYLSDGGHFENLGIYELVRRRCRYIIACDAGEDGAVTFGDLGNAIEKCRADFGVDIEIDVSKIRPPPGSKFSEWHCAIGRIRYDRQGYDEVAGTLLYIKSSLTGDEPADVQRSAAENLAFPHQPTSDQFFDESQFESYRALGFHVSLEVFGPAVGVGTAQGVVSDASLGARQSSIDAVELFTRLGQVWARPAPAPADAVRRYSEALNRIWATVRTTPTLRFLDEQMFPAMPSLIGLPFDLAPEMGMAQGAAGRRLPINYWLPPSDDERREGFYLCNEMLQLMEDVFLEFDLDQYHDHIDNRGWMNLFQHWAWSGMVCATWAITGSTFDPRFQRFCRIRLDLRPGRPGLVGLEDALTLPTGDVWRGKTPEERVAQMGEWQRLARLNFWEVELLAKYLLATKHPFPLKLYPVLVTVESPRRSDGNPLQFNVGYIIGDVVRADGRGPVYSLHFMRIQNHLRKMGLAREALKALQDTESMEIEIVRPDFDKSVADGLLSDEGLPLPNSVRYLERLVRSLPRIVPSSARPR
ncbi:MAG TPA: patatin-like phospholipase family protein [Vicinamibacterales bacterium]